MNPEDARGREARLMAEDVLKIDTVQSLVYEATALLLRAEGLVALRDWHQHGPYVAMTYGQARSRVLVALEACRSASIDVAQADAFMEREIELRRKEAERRGE